MPGDLDVGPKNIRAMIILDKVELRVKLNQILKCDNVIVEYDECPDIQDKIKCTKVAQKVFALSNENKFEDLMKWLYLGGYIIRVGGSEKLCRIDGFRSDENSIITSMKYNGIIMAIFGFWDNEEWSWFHT